MPVDYERLAKLLSDERVRFILRSIRSKSKGSKTLLEEVRKSGGKFSIASCYRKLRELKEFDLIEYNGKGKYRRGERLYRAKVGSVSVGFDEYGHYVEINNRREYISGPKKQRYEEENDTNMLTNLV